MNDVFDEDLKNKAVEQTSISYCEDLSETEISQVKDKLSENSIDIATLEAEKKDIMHDYRIRIKALKEANNINMGEIKTGISTK